MEEIDFIAIIFGMSKVENELNVAMKIFQQR